MPVLYKKIYDSLKNSILGGEMKSGQKLPSSRELSIALGVSRNTVLAAFSHLEAEGFIESRHGSGVFVRKIPLWEVAKNTGLLPDGTERKKTKKIVSLRAGGTDVRHFPFAEFSRLTAKLYRDTEINLAYRSEGGYRPLQEAVASYLRLKRGVRCAAEQIVITNGSQEGIFLAAKFFLEKNKNVYLENPCYNAAKNIFGSLGGRLEFIPVDKDGMLSEKIPDKKGGLVYITPSHQFPLGVTMSIARRLQLLRKAEKQDLVILEDDYDSDFRYNGEPISALQGYDKSGRVVYLGTFSKVLYPGIRLGYMVVPTRFLGDFLKARKIINQDPAMVQQAVVAGFMRSGKFYRHLKKMHGIYHKRKNLMERIIKQKLGDIFEMAECHSGLHLVLYGKSKISRLQLAQEFGRHGLDVGFLSDNYQGNCPREGLLLGFGDLSENEIERALELLGKATKKPRCRGF